MAHPRPAGGSQQINELARRTAHAIRHGANRMIERAGPRVYRGQITQLGPLKVAVLGIDLTITGDDVTFGQDVERYDASEGLAVGDLLALNRVEESEWIAVTVLSDTAIWPVEPPGDPD